MSARPLNRRCEQPLEESRSLGANIWELIFQIRHVACYAESEAKARAAHLSLCWFSSGETPAVEKNILVCPNRRMRLQWGNYSGCFPWISLRVHVRQTHHLTPYTPSAAQRLHNHRGVLLELALGRVAQGLVGGVERVRSHGHKEMISPLTLVWQKVCFEIQVMQITYSQNGVVADQTQQTAAWSNNLSFNWSMGKLERLNRI